MADASRLGANFDLHRAFVGFLKDALGREEVPAAVIKEVREFLKQENCYAVTVDDGDRRTLNEALRAADDKLADDEAEDDDEIVAEDGKVVRLRG